MNIIQGKKMGWIEVVTGGMFSGKTEELIRRLRRAQYARQKVQVFKPLIDMGNSEDIVTSLIKVCQDLANSGVRVVVAGLDQDYLGKPFEPMPQLMAIADYVTKNAAVCMVCCNPATRTQRLSKSTKRVEVGATDQYEARCRVCHDPGLSSHT